MTQDETAMQQLRNKLQVVVDELSGAVPRTDQYGYMAAMENVIKDIDAQMMGIEKEQIQDAFTKGEGWTEQPQKEFDSDAEFYYNQKYKQQP